MRKLAILLFVLVFCALALCADAPNAVSANSITHLYDSYGLQKKGTVLDWGYAALVRYNGKQILFDTGNDPENLAQNMKAMGVNPEEVDFVVISHRHNDHAAGWTYVFRENPKVRVYLPLDPTFAAAPVVLNGPEKTEGAEYPEEVMWRGREHSHNRKPAALFAGSNGEFVRESKEIATGIFIIQTKSELIGDANNYPAAPNGPPKFDGIPELSLALMTKDGLVVITGCSHSGVQEIVTAAKKFAKQDVNLVDGGFHMQPYDEPYIAGIAAKLKQLGVKRVAPAHCTGPVALKIFRKEFGANYHYAGLEAVIPFGN